jgi:hypothetical protein
MSAWPARGSLAADHALLAAATQTLDIGRVLYAEDLDRTRVLVGWQREQGGLDRVTLYAGPRGAGVDQLSSSSTWSGDATDLLVLRESDDNDSLLVALTTPGSKVSVSTGISVGSDGRVTRDAWRTLATKDGVLAEELRDSPPTFMRVVIAGRRDAATPARLTGQPAHPREDTASICLSCTGEEFRARAEEAIAAGDAYRFGLRPQDVRATTRYDGTVDPRMVQLLDPGFAPSTTRVVVVDSTLPGGGVLRSALVVNRAADGSAASTLESATGVPVDAATAADRPFVLERKQADGTVLNQVFAPGAASAQLVSSAQLSHPDSARVPVRNGSALLTTRPVDLADRAYDVVTYDAAGRQIGRWPATLPSDDSWAEGSTP